MSAPTPDAPRIRLITRGDDSGGLASAAPAVVEAFRSGLLRNASVMAPGPNFDAAAPLLREAERDGLCIGLHVTLNSEWDHPRWGPVLPPQRVPSLVDSRGHFTRFPKDLQERKASLDEMLAEAQAQLDRLRGAGLSVTYMDNHMGVGWLPGLADGFKRLAEREGLLFGEGHRGLPKVESPEGDLFTKVAARLRAAAPGTYLFVTHPAYDDAEHCALTMNGESRAEEATQRDADRRLWLDPRLRDLLDECGAVACTYAAASAASVA